MERRLAIEPRKLDWIDGRKPTREELHDRTGLVDTDLLVYCHDPFASPERFSAKLYVR